MPNEGASNSRWMTRDGSVIRLPADSPNTTQVTMSAVVLLVAVMASSAAAWLASDQAANRRMSRRLANAPSPKRPTMAETVSAATENPAWARPMVGSRIAIWCTRKPTCAVSAMANGAATLQNFVLRSALRRVQMAVAGTVLGAVAAATGRSIHSKIAGSRITAITMDDPTMAFENP